MSKQEVLKYAKIYSEAKKLHNEILETFEKIESGNITMSKDRFIFIKLRKDTKYLQLLLNKINIIEIEKEVNNPELVDKIKTNLQLFFETSEYIQKRLLAYEYADDLLVPVKRYIRQIAINPNDYKKWAKHPEELAHKFIEMLTHPDNIETYKNQIKRMALGTMSQREFNKIFEATKHKMVPLPDNKFQSFSDYKEDLSSNPSKPIQYKP